VEVGFFLQFTRAVEIGLTSNTFYGAWYLPHSHVRNERTVPAGCMAHARNSYISTSDPKSDVTMVFLDPDFGDSRTFKADIGLLNICMGFQDLLA